MRDTNQPPLLAEHALLGALMGEPAHAAAPVISYPSETRGGADGEGAALADLTGTCYQLVSGASSSLLALSALAGRELEVGEAAFEAVLSGDGGLVSVPLALRTGDNEYVMLDPSGRGPVLVSWLGFLAAIEQEGRRPFAGAEVQDASSMLVPLLLAGPEAHRVLSDYLSEGVALPGPGQVRSVSLDKISCLVAQAPVGTGEAPRYLVLVPAALSRVLWRSLLSFPEVEPVGTRRAAALLVGSMPWSPLLAPDDVVRPDVRELRGWGLLRDGGGYVGARGLEG